MKPFDLVYIAIGWLAGFYTCWFSWILIQWKLEKWKKGVK